MNKAKIMPFEYPIQCDTDRCAGRGIWKIDSEDSTPGTHRLVCKECLESIIMSIPKEKLPAVKAWLKDKEGELIDEEIERYKDSITEMGKKILELEKEIERLKNQEGKHTTTTKKTQQKSNKTVLSEGSEEGNE